MKRPVRSLAELFERQAEAAVAISGADLSSFTGKTLRVEDADDESLRCAYGLAHPNGDIAYDDRVRRRLEQMFATAEQHHDPETLVRFRNALTVVLHENAHLLARTGTTWRDGNPEYGTPAGRALDEGITEGWSFANLDRYITELGIDEIAPGIHDVVGWRQYPQYHPAAQKFCEALGEHAGLDGATVMTMLGNVNPSDKWRVATDLLWNNSGLPQRFAGPPAAEQKADLMTELRQEFGHLALLEGRSLEHITQASAAAGRRAVDTVVRQIRSLERHVPPPPGLDDRARTAAAQPWMTGTAPFTGVRAPVTGRQPDAGRGGGGGRPPPPPPPPPRPVISSR